MDFSSLDVKIHLRLMKFLDPDDRFNLVLSGMLKGFKNANEGIDLRQRIEGIGIELGPCRDSTSQLEITSLKYRTLYFEQKYMSHMIILERLAARGFFKNNRQVIVIYFWPSFSLLFRFILSMTNLEKLSLSECKLTLTDLRQLFRSCPKLTELHIKLVEGLKMEMDQFLKYELRLGFQRLRLLELHWDIESWPTIQGIFTWLKDCAQLTASNCSWRRPVIDGSLKLNPDLSENLRDLRLCAFPVEFVKWILSFCSNIETLTIPLIGQPNDLHKDIVRLKKLKDLHIGTSVGIDAEEIIRNCRQVEILRLSSSDITLPALAELEHYENLKEAHLHWLYGPSVKEALAMLQRSANLRRLTLAKGEEPSLPSSEELCDFIMKLKHLTFLHIPNGDIPNCGHFKSLVNEVKAFVLPLRPNFKFYVSCCSKFKESRVPRELFCY